MSNHDWGLLNTAFQEDYEKRRQEREKQRLSRIETEPIVAYRVWRYKDGFLTSVVAKTIWLKRMPTGGNIGDKGIYAAKFPNAILEEGYTFDVFGEVYLWGRVVEHQSGFRAEYAYPKLLCVHPDAGTQMVMDLEDGYGVPVEFREEIKLVQSALEERRKFEKLQREFHNRAVVEQYRAMMQMGQQSTQGLQQAQANASYLYPGALMPLKNPFGL